MHARSLEKEALLSSAFGYLLFDKWPDLSSQLPGGDDKFMYRALELASKGVGRTPSPVGSVITKGGKILAEGYHQRPGLPHAEAQTLSAVGQSAQGAELFITLEPCTHFGRTPPCISQVLKSGVTKIRVGAIDPNPKVNGDGLKTLIDEGMDAKLATDAFIAALSQRIISPFATTMSKQRPYIVLKMASSLDGKVAAATGHETQITGAASSVLVHRLRDRCDAIAVGKRTVEIDDPKLTVREIAPEGERQPLRVVFDSKLSLSVQFQVFAANHAVVIHDADAPLAKQKELDALSIDRISVSAKVPLFLTDAMAQLCKKGVTSLLVEGGPQLWTSFINAGLVDEVWWLTAPCVLGEQGVSAIENVSVNARDWLASSAHGLHTSLVDRDQLTIIRIQKPL